jgi:hypothetical protein
MVMKHVPSAYVRRAGSLRPLILTIKPSAFLPLRSIFLAKASACSRLTDSLVHFASMM